MYILIVKKKHAYIGYKEETDDISIVKKKHMDISVLKKKYTDITIGGKQMEYSG